MKNRLKQNLKRMSPLIISILIITTILILSFIFNIDEYPLWINENGVIETLSAIGYFVAALWMILKGRWAYIKQYHYFFILMILFGLRELDFHKKFTTMGIFKIKFYLSDHVDALEKLIGLLVISLLIYILITIIKKHTKCFFTKIKALSPIYIGISVTILLLVISKTIDGLARKLSALNIVISQQTKTHFEVIEEVLELGIPLFIIATLIIYFSKDSHKKLKSKT